MTHETIAEEMAAASMAETKRQRRFEAACAAMQGLLANQLAETRYRGDMKLCVPEAFEIADLFMAELERTEKKDGVRVTVGKITTPGPLPISPEDFEE